MKLVTGSFLLMSALGATGELEIPRSVFRMDQIADAKAEASRSVKPLVFVYTDPGTR
jgi:hypothetical protein